VSLRKPAERETGEIDPPPTSPAGPPDKPGDPPPLRSKDPLWARLLIVLGVILVVLSGGLLGTSAVLAYRYDHAVKKDALLAPDARVDPDAKGADAPASQLVGPLNYLLLGSDARDGSPEAGQRSDTIIIAHIPATLDHVYLVSIPRDLRVQIPPFPLTNFKGSHEKVNAAFEYGGGGSGGVQLVSSTLTDLLGIRFDGAAVIDFSGFKDVVKQLGGIHMCVDVRTVSDHMGFDSQGHYLNPHEGGRPVVYEPGCREFNDWEALDFVRQRKSLPDGDYGRQRHEQQFLQAILVRARERGLATNPIKLDQLIQTVAGTLTVDTNGVPLKDLMFGLRDIRSDAITGVTLPSEPAMIGDTSYVLALEREAPGLYEALANDTLGAWVDANPKWTNPLT
jgi:LCP family protein required for cell wall assembly